MFACLPFFKERVDTAERGIASVIMRSNISKDFCRRVKE
jgi:hypothetical protein